MWASVLLGIEYHVIKQICAIRGLFGELIEYWIGWCHKTGFKYDIEYTYMARKIEKAVVRAK